MSSRVVLALATTALVLGGLAAPALAGSALDDPIGLDDPTTICVVTHYDKKTNERDGYCVWLPVGGSDTVQR